MSINQKTFHNYKGLLSFIKETKVPLVFRSSGTSTVLAFDKIPEPMVICDLSCLPKTLKLINNYELEVKGPVSWSDAREFLKEFNLDIMTAPTEDSALILAGIATSATGERAFGHGTLRDQIVKISYINARGESSVLESLKSLKHHKALKNTQKELKDYQELYSPYKNSKNAPFPRYENETDLLIGSEGQLGLITGCILKVTKLLDYIYVLIKVPKFEIDIDPHLEVFQKIQLYRSKITACELIDSNSSGEQYDGIYLEIKSEYFELIYTQLLSQFEYIPSDDIYELTKAKYKDIRERVPRETNEYLSRKSLVKKGTDAQAVDIDGFAYLLELYQDFAKKGVKYQLFGHFGDAHLHFNFLPTKDQMKFCDECLEDFYDKVCEKKISPFAEHGIGLIKKKYIKNFLTKTHYKLFKILKSEMDSDNIFFPLGFMGGELTL